MRDLRALIQEIVKEEVGRSYRTTLPPEDAMFNWQKVPGVRVELFPDPMHNCWRVVINYDETGEQLVKSFRDENEAKMFARLEAEKVHRKNQSDIKYPVNAIRYF
jgi:hypothetical protein